MSGNQRPFTSPSAARNIQVIVLQLGKLDLASPAGKPMLNMLAAVAEMEWDLLKQSSLRLQAFANWLRASPTTLTP